MKYTVTLLPGDGIGPDVVRAARSCIDATGVKIKWEEHIAGEGAIKEFNDPLPEHILDSIRRNKVCLKGPIITPIAGGFRSVNVRLRQELDLFVCLRPAKSYEGIPSNFKDIDIVVMRENTEDLYAGIEFEGGQANTNELISYINKFQAKRIRQDSSLSIKPISRYASERIVRFAFDYALKNKRKKVTAVHKANIMKATDGLFLNTAREISREYEGKIEFQEAIVDNLAMQLVKNPHNFDILVLPNLYGDIISDLCAGLVGGLGVAPGANLGRDIGVFEPVHGAAPKYKGLNKVNPIATILSGVLMLRYLAEPDAADRLEHAVCSVLKKQDKLTYDLKENRNDPTACTTEEMAEAIIKEL